MKRYFTALYALPHLFVPAAAQEPELSLDPLTYTESKNEAAYTLPVETEHAITTDKRSLWQFGVTAGYLHSMVDWVAVSPDPTYNGRDYIRSHPGFTAGFCASYPFAEVWSFDTGVNLSMWGFGYKSAEVSVRCDRYVIEVPFLVTFFESDAYIPVFLQAGFLGGINAAAVQSLSVNEGTPPWEGRRAWDAFNKLSFGAVLGIGYGHFTFQFINNFTNTWSREMSRSWEEYTGQTIDLQTSRAYSLTYTYWF